MGDEQDPWHQGGAGAQCCFTRDVDRMTMPDQLARKPSAREAADAGKCIRNPGEGADTFDVESARVVEILRQPEEVEIPSGVAQELRGHQAPDLRNPKKPEP